MQVPFFEIFSDTLFINISRYYKASRKSSEYRLSASFTIIAKVELEKMIGPINKLNMKWSSFGVYNDCPDNGPLSGGLVCLEISDLYPVTIKVSNEKSSFDLNTRTTICVLKISKSPIRYMIGKFYLITEMDEWSSYV